MNPSTFQQKGKNIYIFYLFAMHLIHCIVKLICNAISSQNNYIKFF